MRFRILGPFEADVDGVPVRVTRRLERRLLIVLLLHPGRPVHADQLVDLLWGEEPPDRARASLHAMVSRLRAVFGRTRLVAAHGGYLLDVDPDRIDASLFRTRLAEAAAEPRAGRRAALLREALDLWRGDLPEDLAPGGLFIELAGARATAVEDCFAAGLESGRHAALLPELVAACAEHPDRERLAALRMLALHRSGRTAEALTGYEDTRRHLASRGSGPGPELRETYLRVLRDEPPTATPPPPSRPPAQLPGDPAGFVGRTAQLDALENLCGHPVVLVTGPAGVGKTALSTRWARRAAARYPDGQLHLDLRGYDRPVAAGETLGRFLRALGMPADQVPHDEAEASAALRTRLAGTRTLLVLDNAGSADQVLPLVPDVPGCLILVTSRDRLPGLDAPHLQDRTLESPDPRQEVTPHSPGPPPEPTRLVSGLPPDAAGVLRVGRLALDVLGAEEAEDLLAQIVGPDRLRAEPEATAGLVEACARLPLALRIAAAHLADRPGLTVAAQLAQLRGSDALAELAIDGDPQSAVRAAFDQSYASLEPDVRRMFRLVGVLAAPDFGVSSAAVLADVPEKEARRLLDRLSGVHLIAESGKERYTRHDLLLLYSRQRSTEEPDLAAARIRLYQWQAGMAVAAGRIAFPEVVVPSLSVPSAPDFPGRDAATAWLDAEHGELWQSVVEAGPNGSPTHACVLAEILEPYHNRSGVLTDMTAIAEAHVAAARMTGDPRAEAEAWTNLGFVQRTVGRLDDAVQHFRAALVCLRLAGAREIEASRMISLGTMLRTHGNVAEALDVHEQALALQIDLGLAVDEAVNRANIGYLRTEQGLPTEAVEMTERAVASLRELDTPVYLAVALMMSGYAQLSAGQPGTAARHLAEAARIFRELSLPLHTGWTMAILAWASAECGRFDEAPEMTAEAIALIRPFAASYRSRVHLHSGAAFRACGDRETAREHYEHGLTLARKAQTPYLEADAFVGLASVTNGTASVDHAEAALAVCRKHGYHGLLAAADRLIGHSSPVEILGRR